MSKPKIRFKGFTDDWEQRKLIEICDYVDYRGKTPQKTKTGIFLVTAKNVKDGYIDYEASKEYISYKDYDEVMKRGMPEIGDVLFTTEAPCGNVAQVDKPNIALAQRIIKYRGKDNIINNNYLKYYLLAPTFQKNIDKKSSGGTVQGIKGSVLHQQTIQYPSYIEQQKVGMILNIIDNLITLHQRKYDKLVNIKKSMLEKMFPQNGASVPEIRFKEFTDDWEQRKLGDLVIDHNAGIYISKEDYGEGINVIGVGNIYDRDIFNGEIYRLGSVNDDKFILEENDIIYGESSLVPEGIARTVCVGKNGAGSAFAWHTRRVKLDKNIVNSHVATLELNYLHDIRKYLVSVSTQTALTGMTTEGYFGTTLTLPSVEEQQKISGYFKNLDNLITLHQRKIEKLKNIKKSCLEKMFV